MHKTFTYKFDKPFQTAATDGRLTDVDEIEMRAPCLQDGFLAMDVSSMIVKALSDQAQALAGLLSSLKKEDLEDQKEKNEKEEETLEERLNQILIPITTYANMEKLISVFLRMLKKVAVLKNEGEIIEAHGSMKEILSAVSFSDIKRILGEYYLNFLEDKVAIQSS